MISETKMTMMKFLSPTMTVWMQPLSSEQTQLPSPSQNSGLFSVAMQRPASSTMHLVPGSRQTLFPNRSSVSWPLGQLNERI